jgi:2-iminobutanoate/2-iminopropanoate deaminase
MTDNALPPPGGPYSASVRRGNLVFTAGQVGYHPDRTLPDTFDEQARVALRNLEVALAQQSATLADVVTVNVFLTSTDDFAKMNDIYREFFTHQPLPARTTVTVTLNPGVLFEVNAQAVLD